MFGNKVSSPYLNSYAKSRWIVYEGGLTFYDNDENRWSRWSHFSFFSCCHMGV
ncbi:hypothetical protein HMPREF1991_00028 [Hoylesella loescheii DSM 19665 = JCM 12249 = ATCC 15930]|uniref:Uncharacterized protein n=1 Tax=Hoylesella loescheii DSM 19665 = JCM 12249 = ATCC 15930 TaxID=1122985 RepID=A0A069QMG8_HOYLO|nr:hypothetical protein HMPREF1991_00028 [Hoylesella loescheii DSM 19665 = JCM 12249 = ATCC 15930]